MASERQKKEVADKVTSLIETKYDGDYVKAFDAHDSNKDGKIDADELKAVLIAAGIGNGLTRHAWIKGVMAEMDKDCDGKISYKEFRAALPG